MSTPATLPEVLHFQPDGTGAGLYTEIIDLRELGVLDVSRASHVEFDIKSQQWEVRDFTGHVIFTDPSREVCLLRERETFNQSTPTNPTD